MMVALPAPATLATPFANEITDVSDDEYDHDPSDVDVGGVKVKSGSLTTF